VRTSVVCLVEVHPSAVPIQSKGTFPHLCLVVSGDVGIEKLDRTCNMGGKANVAAAVHKLILFLHHEKTIVYMRHFRRDGSTPVPDVRENPLIWPSKDRAGNTCGRDSFRKLLSVHYRNSS